jgi:hypothetical protein
LMHLALKDEKFFGHGGIPRIGRGAASVVPPNALSLY